MENAKLPYTYERSFSEGGQRYVMGFVLGVVVTVVFASQLYGYLLGHHSNIGEPMLWVSQSLESKIQLLVWCFAGVGLLALPFKEYRQFGFFSFFMGAVSSMFLFGAFYNPLEGMIWFYSYYGIPQMSGTHNKLILYGLGYLVVIQTAIMGMIKGGVFKATGTHGTAEIINGDHLKEGVAHTVEELKGGFSVWSKRLYSLLQKLPDKTWDILKRKPYPASQLDRGIILGRHRKDNTLLRYRDNKHLVTIAPTRSGKGVGLVIPNLLDYEDNIIVFDTKGDNCDVTWHYRSKQLKQEVYVIDPFGESHYSNIYDSNKLNPLDYVQPGRYDTIEQGDKIRIIDIYTGEVFDQGEKTDKDGNPVTESTVTDKIAEAKEYADAIAGAIIPTRKKNASNKGDHWEVTGRNLLSGLIYYVATSSKYNGNAGHNSTNRNLTSVLELLGMNPDGFELFCTQVVEDNTLPKEAKRFAQGVLNKASRELSSIISTAQSNLEHAINNRRIQKVTEESDFKLDNVINSPATLYVIIPADKIETYNGYVRILVNLLLKRGVSVRDTAEESTSDRKTLVMLDEFRNLGYLQPIEQAYTLLAGYGFIFWVFLQNLDNLKSLYGDEYSTFMGNAGIVNAFNVNDNNTAKYLSEKSGVTTVVSESQSAKRQRMGSGINRTSGDSSSLRETRRKVVTPDEVKRLPTDHQMIFHQGYNPSLAKKIFFKNDEYLQGRFWRSEDIYQHAIDMAEEIKEADKIKNQRALDTFELENKSLGEITKRVGQARRELRDHDDGSSIEEIISLDKRNKILEQAVEEYPQGVSEERYSAIHNKIFGESGNDSIEQATDLTDSQTVNGNGPTTTTTTSNGSQPASGSAQPESGGNASGSNKKTDSTGSKKDSGDEDQSTEDGNGKGDLSVEPDSEPASEEQEEGMESQIQVY